MTEHARDVRTGITQSAATPGQRRSIETEAASRRGLTRLVRPHSMSITPVEKIHSRNLTTKTRHHEPDQ